MSENIITALIAAIAAIIAAGIPIYFTKRSERAKKARQVNAATLPVNSSKSVERIGKESPLSHAEIVLAIESAPPFHQQQIHDEFLGVEVTWPTRLSSISRLRSTVVVFADIPGGPGTLSCYCVDEEARKFVAAQAKTDFVVTGRIDRVSKYEVSLVNCRFSIPKKSG